MDEEFEKYRVLSPQERVKMLHQVTAQMRRRDVRIMTEASNAELQREIVEVLTDTGMRQPWVLAKIVSSVN